MHLYAHTFIGTCMYIYLHTHMPYIHTHAYTFTHLPVHIFNTHVYTYIHTHTIFFLTSLLLLFTSPGRTGYLAPSRHRKVRTLWSLPGRRYPVEAFTVDTGACLWGMCGCRYHMDRSLFKHGLGR